MNTLKTRTFITALVAFVFNALDTFGVLVPDKVKVLINEFLALAFVFFLRDAVSKNGTVVETNTNQPLIPEVAPLELNDQDYLLVAEQKT